MKTLLNRKLWTQQKQHPPAVAANKLCGIKAKDYILIGFRDTEAESATHQQLDFLTKISNFRIPRLYTLISQNRKISIKENLSNSTRIFINFDSFKWSELFFNFFRHIVSPRTEQFIFRHLLYSLDLYVCHYQLLTMALKNSTHNFQSVLQRHKNKIQFISSLCDHQHREKLFLIFILELFLISIGKGYYTFCASLVTKAESQLLLHYFKSQNLITLEFDKLCYSPENLLSSLKKYFDFHGQILLTEKTANIFNENSLSHFRKIFEENQADIDHKSFETCFTHK